LIQRSIPAPPSTAPMTPKTPITTSLPPRPKPATTPLAGVEEVAPPTAEDIEARTELRVAPIPEVREAGREVVEATGDVRDPPRAEVREVSMAVLGRGVPESEFEAVADTDATTEDAVE